MVVTHFALLLIIFFLPATVLPVFFDEGQILTNLIPSHLVAVPLYMEAVRLVSIASSMLSSNVHSCLQKKNCKMKYVFNVFICIICNLEFV